MMILFSIDEFAARRRKAQDDAIATLLPVVTGALDDFPADDWFEPILDKLHALFLAFVKEDAGELPASAAAAWTTLRRLLRTALSKTKEPTTQTAQTIAVFLSSAAMNSASIVAAQADEDDLFLEWVTMHDSHVRVAHRDTDGQVRPIGEKYDVAGVEMAYPGDPTAPIELWINCRCALRPVLASDVSSLTGRVVETGLTAFISEKPWSGASSRFTDEQWKASCCLHLANTLVKADHKLPIKEPGGALSRAGVHAAAGRINQVQAPSPAKASAKRALRGAYKQLGEEPPDSIAATIKESDTGVAMSEPAPEVAPPLVWHGILAPEGEWSGDGRMFAANSLTNRDLPLPLTWQKSSSEGHDGSVTVAKIEKLERVDGMMRASGTWLMSPEADEVVGLIAEFGKYGVSVDADSAEFEFDEETGQVTFQSARICSASIVSIPAFAQAYVALGPWDDAEPIAASVNIVEFGRGPGWVTNPEDTKRLHDYWTVPGEPGYAKVGWGVPGDFNRCRVEVGEEIGENSPDKLRFLNQICAQWHHDALGFWPGRAPSEQALTPEGDMAPAVHLVASVGHIAPSEWFTDPKFTAPTAIKITDEGRVFGHLAEWTTCHVGYDSMCVSPPHSASNYAYFLTGEVATDKGPIPVGNLTIGGGHAPAGLRARAAVAHYDSTSAAFADVTCGEDDYGIWVAGWVRPGVDADMVTAARASNLSGDWREIRGELEMVAGLAVNVPGFPVVRPRVAASNGSQVALVAAGVVARDEQAPVQDWSEFAEAIATAIEARAQRRVEMAALAAQFEEENA